MPPPAGQRAEHVGKVGDRTCVVVDHVRFAEQRHRFSREAHGVGGTAGTSVELRANLPPQRLRNPVVRCGELLGEPRLALRLVEAVAH